MLELTVDWNDPTPERTTTGPYNTQRTPRGSVVVCEAHVVTDELKNGEAIALAKALNMEFETRMLRK
jgi:hypothetical protein